MKEIIIECLKYVVLITGILDSYKYKLQAQKIARLKTSGQISRASLVYSFLHKVPLLLYVWLAFNDTILTITCSIAIYTMLEAFYYTYMYYPYRNRGLKNFKKPTLFKFTKDIFFPNKHGKKL